MTSIDTAQAQLTTAEEAYEAAKAALAAFAPTPGSAPAGIPAQYCVGVAEGRGYECRCAADFVGEGPLKAALLRVAEASEDLRWALEALARELGEVDD